MLTPLVWISGSTVAIMLVVVAGCAGYLSLWLSYQDLSARGEWAISRIERVLRNNEVTGRNTDVRSLLDGFDVDPDILAFFVSDKAGHELYAHRSASDELGARAANLLRGSKAPSANADFVIVSQALEGAGAAKRATFAYDIRPAQRKALLELWFYGVGGILALLVALPVLLFMFRRQMIPMRHLTEIMSEMADENYGSAVSGQDRADEIGTIARAIHACRERLVDRERLRAIADEDVQRSSDRHALMGRRVDTFRSTIGSSLREVAGLSDQMQVAADSLASIAKQTTARAESAVSAIGRTSVNVSEVAEASESLSASIREIEKQAEQTRGIVTAASRSALEMNSLIKGLYAKSETIDEIIVLIQAIAAQTNMLSLNATIEAARAGESGRGFAVVAQEVKSLADQTAQASQHVAEHVRSIQKAALQAVQAMTTIDATMAQADRFSAIIAEAVELQSGASVSISQSAAHAAKSAGEAAETMRRLAATIGETDQSAAQVHSSATDVGRQASDLSTTIDGFLADTISLRADAVQQRSARA